MSRRGRWTPPGPVCPRCGLWVSADSVVISHGPHAGETRHRTCITERTATVRIDDPSTWPPDTEDGGAR